MSPVITRALSKGRGQRARSELDSTTSSKFRPDIQGLRTLAVVAVILAHANIPGFRGGFIGVDIFFVISGFLITGLLLGDIAKFKKVRFLTFYARRVARILPAASVVIVTTCLASVTILGVIQARSVLIDGIWAVFFGANIHFAAVGTDYFSTAGTSPLQHFWSLAVEEQFYLVWPTLLGFVALIFKHRSGEGEILRLPIGLLLVVAGGGSLFLSITQTASNPSAAYFSTIDRVWELAIGAGLAVGLPTISKIPHLGRVLLSWSGIGAIVAAAVLFNSTTATPGWKALLPVLGSAGVIVGGIHVPRGGAHHLLSLRPFRFIGDISYSLYLWHFPVLILGAVYFGAGDTLAVRAGLITGSFLLATASYYGLENPVRHAKMIQNKTWRGLAMWPIATGLVVAVSVLAVPSVPFALATTPVASMSAELAVSHAVAAALSSAPVPSATVPSLLNATTDNVNLGACSAYLKLTEKICNYGDPTGTKTMIVFGNSHSAMWVPALAFAAKAAHWKLYPLVKESCGYPVYVDLNHNWGPQNVCTLWYNWALAQTKRLHPYEIIVGSYTGSNNWIAGERLVLAQLKPLAPKIVLLGDTPAIPNPAECLLANGATQKTCLVIEPVDVVTAQIQAKALVKAAHANYLDVTTWFCDSGLCPSVINDVIPFYDGLAHVTPQYSAFLGPDMSTALDLNGSSLVALVPVPVIAASAPTTSSAP